MKLLRSVIAVLALLCAAPVWAATLLPPGEIQFSDANGNPYAGGKVYFYIPNTSTPKNTYLTASQSVLNSNPVILDAAGRAIIYGDGMYRQVLKDSVGNLVWDQPTASTQATTGTILWGSTSTGSANTQSINVTGFTATDGQVVGFVAGFTNTGAMTIDAGTGGIAVRSDTLSGPVALVGGEVRASNVVIAVYTGGFFHLVSTPFPTVNYQAFAAAGSFTWTKPGNLTTSSQSYIECWGAGGGGGANATGGAGGGGGYLSRWLSTSSLGATETVTIAAGGAINTNGSASTFGSWVSAGGGGHGANTAGGGGGGGGGTGSGVASTTTTGGSGGPFQSATPGAPAGGGGLYGGDDGGGGGGGTSGPGGSSHFGGGGGGGGADGSGGKTLYGGGGGASGTGLQGSSLYAGDGGANGIAGSAPSGGGGRNAAGARGECRVTTFP